MTNDALRRKALEYLVRHERNRSWLASKWGVSPAFVTLFLKGERDCSDATAESLLTVLRTGKAA